MISRLDKTTSASLWTPAESAAPIRTPARTRLKAVLLPLSLTVLVGVGVLLPATLTYEARVALFTFFLATILWSTTTLNAAYVALSVTTLLVLLGGRPQEVLYESMASDVVWLMIGAFVLGEAVKKTALAERLTNAEVARAGRVGQVFWLLTGALSLLAFFIPSTSGRAAVAMPVFDSLSDRINDRGVTRALSLLIPTVILVTTICTIIGAGCHLIANDFLQQVSATQLSFLDWAIYGLPFGLAAGAVSCFVIQRLFLSAEQRTRQLERPTPTGPRTYNLPERKTLAVTALMVVLWVTERLHHVDIALVTMVGALILTAPGFGVLTWKEGLKSVSWNLIIFVGASLVLGKALIDTKAAQWIIDGIFALSHITPADPPYLTLLLVTVVSLTSHLYMTSHTARVAALMPMLIFMATSLNINPVAVVFIGVVGMDYCLTFPVSSKALLMFQELDRETYRPRDLLRLSAVLLLVHAVLMLAFYYGYWQFVGLHL
jgi:anion transporter